MKPKRIFLTKDKKAVIRCESCGRSKSYDIQQKPIKTGRPVRVKCPCGDTFTVVFDARRHYRKNVNIPGSYIRVSKDDEKIYPMTILDVSMSGLRFATMGEAKLEIGEILTLEFNLSDDSDSDRLIRCSAIVRNIIGDQVGVEFQFLDEFVKKELGFCLLP